MKSINERKRAKITGRGGLRHFTLLTDPIMDSPEWAQLVAPAMKMVLYLARQYYGKNNGQLTASCPLLNHWKSNRQKTYALKVAEEGGWILKNKQGGLGIGPTFYAVSWFSIDKVFDDQLLEPTTVAPNTWKQKNAIPDTGALSHPIRVLKKAA